MSRNPLNRPAILAAGALLLVAAGLGGGYWLGRTTDMSATQADAVSGNERQPLYYRNPMGHPDTSPVPKKDSMGMDYIPVYAEAEEEAAPTAGGERKPLYYRNPMGHPDTSPVPKKDSMGMDYIPVYEEDTPSSGGASLKISPEKVQMLGVRSEPASRRTMMRPVRAVGTVQLDERRQSVVTLKFEGWIEKLRVNTTGQAVRKGEILFEVYSPDLVLAQQEYLLAKRALEAAGDAAPAIRADAERLVRAALSRLAAWDIPRDRIARLERDGAVARTLPILAPGGGLVIEKAAVEGLHVAPGEMLYRIADLSTVWLLAEIYEQDLALVAPGQDVAIKVDAFPGKDFTGTVDFIYPTVNRETRTAKVRVEVPNPERLLRADMYASVDLAAPLGDAMAVVVPESAVLDSGVRQTVLVEKGQGRYEPRAVRLGGRADGYVEIQEGLEEGENVVVSANFLIDAESNLRAALKAFATPETGSP